MSDKLGASANADRAATPSERWRQVVGFEGLYEVSNLGRVRNFRGQVLAQHDDGKGYLQIGLFNGSVKISLKVHRLVCWAFHGPPQDGQEVAHLDGDPHNPNADNLAWVNRKENHSHKAIHGTRQIGKRNGRCKFSDDLIERARWLHRGGYSEVMIAERTGISPSHVHRIISKELRNA